MKNGKPVFAFVGYGRAGKDTAAEYFHEITGLAFHGGCSWTACAYMAKRLSQDYGRHVSWDEAYKTRHDSVEMRTKWYNYINEYRAKDPPRLIRDCLEHSDIVCGPRDKLELRTAKGEGLLDLIVWIDRDVPVDPTVTFNVYDADIVIYNHHDTAKFYEKLRRLAASYGLLKPIQDKGYGQAHQTTGNQA